MSRIIEVKGYWKQLGERRVWVRGHTRRVGVGYQLKYKNKAEVN